MLKCLSLKSSSAASSLPPSPAAVNHHSPPPPRADPSSQANSTDGTPRASTQPSPTMNLTREYTFALETNSYKEMVSRIIEVHGSSHIHDQEENEEKDEGEEEGRIDQLDEEVLLSQVLHPNRECVDDALRHAKQPRNSRLTELVSQYFDHSEKTTRNLCHLLCQSIYRARTMYSPIHNLLDVLPIDYLTQAQCDRVCDVFQQFVRVDNPFSCPADRNFQETRRCFSELKQQLDQRLQKSQSSVGLCKHAKAGSAYCLIGATVGVFISALVIATHAVAAIAVACPFCASAYLRPDFNRKKSVAHVKQIDTYVLNNHLATIACLVVRLHTAIEDDKWWIRLGLERGRDLYPIQEVLKQLHKTHGDFNVQLKNLEDHIYLCFVSVNKARSRLLQEIHPQSPQNSQCINQKLDSNICAHRH